MSQPLHNPPGPPPRRGVLDSLGYFYHFLTDPLGYVESRFERYGDIYYAPSGGVGLYVLRHPDHLHQVLVRDAASYSKSHSALSSLTDVIGHGLLTTDGAVWRRQRRMVQPAFSRARLEGYTTAMAAGSVASMADWKHGERRDIGRDMMELTLRIVCQTLFSHDVRGQADDVAHAMEAFQRHLARPNVLPKWLPVPNAKEQAVSTLDKIIYGMLEQRRREQAKPGGCTPDPPDVLHMLLHAIDEEGDGAGLGDREIRDQLVTLFLAGHETTSHALAWTWFLLAQNPQAERKLHRELAEVLAGRTPEYADLAQLPYTRQVVEEAMRLYPPAYTVARRAEVDTAIGDYAVPAGSEVILWIYMTHRDPRWYPQPDVYRPERFDADQVHARPKLAYLPFGAGARACIGKIFALIEAQIAVATIAQRYRLKLAPGRLVRPRARITLAPQKLTMELVDRRREQS